MSSPRPKLSQGNFAAARSTDYHTRKNIPLVSLRQTINTYYQLTKPGIIYGNIMTGAAGFFLATGWHWYGWLLPETLAGIGLVIASACVFNNYIDRGIDKKMNRTKKRALVTGAVSGPQAIIYACLLGAAGFVILMRYTNELTMYLGILAIVSYVVLYGYAKRKTVHGTLVGTIPGALPMVAGYTAVTGVFDAAAIILFLIMVFWQLPHFYAIAMYRRDDYKAAGIPVLPVVKGMYITKVSIVFYVAAFIVTVTLLTVFGFTGYIYLVGALVLGLLWFRRGVKGFTTMDDIKWARGMFFFSLMVLTSMSVLIPLGGLLP